MVELDLQGVGKYLCYHCMAWIDVIRKALRTICN